MMGTVRCAVPKGLDFLPRLPTVETVGFLIPSRGAGLSPWLILTLRWARELILGVSGAEIN
jgi:hypothetical protein